MTLKKKLAFILCTLLGGVVVQAGAEWPQEVFLQSLEANGTGCPAGSYSATISPDGQSFSILLDKYVAASNVQVPLVRQNCQFSINFHVPLGWTFAMVSADYRGFAYAEQGTRVMHQALYSFEGSQPIGHRRPERVMEKHSFRSHQIQGPFNDNYIYHQDLDQRSTPWAPCNSDESQTLVITTSLMAQVLPANSNRQAQITLDSLDGSVQSQHYQFIWKRCEVIKPVPPPHRDQRPVPMPREPDRGGRDRHHNNFSEGIPFN